MPAGRPKEPFVPWDNWYNDILNLYREGGSDVEVRGLLIEKSLERETFSWDIWDRWLKEEEQFSETIKMGRMLSEIWWRREGRQALRDKDFNYTGWYMNMKNRFGWKDKHEHTGNNNGPIVVALNKDDERI